MDMVKDGKVLTTESKYAAELRTKSAESVMYILEDAAAAHHALPDGKNAGFYVQEVVLCGKELIRRRNN